MRIKETVSQVIRNCPECSEMNKGLAAMKQHQQQNGARYVQAADGQQQLSLTPPVGTTPPVSMSPSVSMNPPVGMHSPLTMTPPAPMNQPNDIYAHLQAHAHQDSPNNQLQMEAQQHDTYSQFAHDNDFNDMPVDPALMEGIQHNASLADLPPSPFLTAGHGLDGIPRMGDLDIHGLGGDEERAPTAREEIRRRIDRANLVGGYGQ